MTNDAITITTLLDAGQTRDGNPRRIYRIDTIRQALSNQPQRDTIYVLEGYDGDNNLHQVTTNTPPHRIIRNGTIRITPTQNRALTRNRTRP